MVMVMVSTWMGVGARVRLMGEGYEVNAGDSQNEVDVRVRSTKRMTVTVKVT